MKRSEPKIGWTVGRSGERAMQKNDGAERSVEREVSKRGAVVTEIR